MLRQIMRMLAFALQGVAFAVTAQGAAPCAIVTHSEKIGSGTIVYNIIGAGPNVLLIHGLFANKEQWNALACRLADAGYKAIAVDLPGYGKSDGFSLPDYKLENQVDKLHTLMTRLNIEHIDLAGNSMGGAIASMYASRFPQQVRSVAFIGSPLGIVGWSQGMQNAIYRGINPFIPINEQQLDLELRLLFVTLPAIPGPERKDIVANYVLRNRHYVQVWNIVNLYNDVLAQRPPAQKSTLIIWGDDDRIYNVAGARKLHRRIPGSEVHQMPHAGHLVHLENAAEVAPIYVDFLKNGVQSASQPSGHAATPANAKSAPVAKTTKALFTCDAGKTMEAVFINGKQSSVKLTLSDGRELSVPQAMSGSGARYANGNESFVFWNTGNTAFIEENGKTTYSGCTTMR